ncbi:MAG: outer membrane beta-barrel protein [Bacteroidia bacterium]
MKNTNSEGDLIADTQNQNKNVKRSYTDVFPSMGLTYTVNKNNSLSLIYSSRIDRPNYRELNP